MSYKHFIWGYLASFFTLPLSFSGPGLVFWDPADQSGPFWLPHRCRSVEGTGNCPSQQLRSWAPRPATAWGCRGWRQSEVRLEQIFPTFNLLACSCLQNACVAPSANIPEFCFLCAVFHQLNIVIWWCIGVHANHMYMIGFTTKDASHTRNLSWWNRVFLLFKFLRWCALQQNVRNSPDLACCTLDL